MNTTYVFLADGFEEVEALTCVDLLRRAQMDVKMVSIKSGLQVVGAHGIKVDADVAFGEVSDYADAEWLVLPGGMPGATNLAAHAALAEVLKARNAQGGKIAAICASPAVVLAPLGILNGKRGVCYPGFEGNMAGCDVDASASVVVDGNVTTGNGPAAATAFALQLVAISLGDAAAKSVAEGMLLSR